MFQSVRGEWGVLGRRKGILPLILPPYQFMEQENCSNLLHFWLLAENFYSQMSSPQYQHNIETDMLDAMTIYDR